MEKMKSVYFAEKDKIEMREVEVPRVGPGMVKIKTAYAALCATDVHMVTMGVLGAQPGIPLGHEASGIITELGEGTEKYGYQVGDKVVTAPVAVCQKCPMCKKGLPQYCQNAAPVAAFSEYIVTDISAVYQIPADADLKKYALAEPAVCTIRAMDLAGIKHGQTVAVSGIGGIGSILLNMVLLAGGAKITAIDPVPEKRELALSMGAAYALDPFHDDLEKKSLEITGGDGFDHVFEVSGSPKAANVCLDMVAHCGKVTYFAVFPPSYEMSLNLYQLYMKEASIQTVFTSHYLFPRAINLIPRVQTDKIIGKVLPLSQALEAFELFKESKYPKILLEC
jgi:2-desacetyl-2-hydroxyethyl bacteriochlorophyllide A dehydrogenase